MKRNRGITLLECLIASLVLAVLLATAIPLVGRWIDKAQMAAVGTRLAESVLLAHRAAIASGTRTVLCPTAADAAGCVEGSDWSEGWLAFADRDGNRRLDAGDTLLARYPGPGGRLRLLSTDARPRIVFQAEGDNAGTNLTFTVCARHAQPVSIVLSNSSRMRTEPAPAATAGDCPQGG